MIIWRGLEKLKTNNMERAYCPKCGNELIVVPNGFFEGELFYCHKEQLVFHVILKRSPRVSKEFIDQCEKEWRFYEVKNMINFHNSDEIYKQIKSLNS